MGRQPGVDAASECGQSMHGETVVGFRSGCRRWDTPARRADGQDGDVLVVEAGNRFSAHLASGGVVLPPGIHLGTRLRTELRTTLPGRAVPEAAAVRRSQPWRIPHRMVDPFVRLLIGHLH